MPETFKPRTEPPVATATGATKAQHLQHISQQLDCFGPNDMLLEKYILLGPEERRRGGQAVVQFAVKSDRREVAIKLFAKQQDYDEEAELYKTSPQRFFMPNVENYVGNEDRAAEGPFGGHAAIHCDGEGRESAGQRTEVSR